MFKHSRQPCWSPRLIDIKESRATSKADPRRSVHDLLNKTSDYLLDVAGARYPSHGIIIYRDLSYNGKRHVAVSNAADVLLPDVTSSDRISVFERTRQDFYDFTDLLYVAKRSKTIARTNLHRSVDSSIECN